MRRVLKALVTRVVEKGLPDNLLQGLGPRGKQGAGTLGGSGSTARSLRGACHTRRNAQYLYGLLCAARTARAVGLREFSAIEFGVAGGNGLVACYGERATAVEQQTKMSIRIFGFDSGAGSRRVPIRGTARSRSGAANSR